MPARRRDPISVPRTFHSSSRPYKHDYGIDESISRAGFFSNAVLEDTDAAAAHSRAKDYDLMRNTQSAIAATEVHSTPRAAVASMRARASSVPPKVQARPARLQQQLVNRPKVAPSVIFMSAPVASPNLARKASTPVVQQGEVPWRVRASSVQPDMRARRAGSVPPRPLSYHQGIYEPEPQTPLVTENLRAHRSPVVLRRSRAGSMPPPRPRSLSAIENLPPPRMVRAGSVYSPRPQSYYPVEKEAVGTEGLRAHRPPSWSGMSHAQSVSRQPRKPLDFGVDEVELERSISKAKAKANEKKPIRGFASRATSEPPRFIPPSSTYPIISDAQPRIRGRQLFTRRGQVIPSVPSRSVPAPPLYVPGYMAKAAIIGSKMETEDGGKPKRKLRPLYHVEKSREPSAGGSHQSAIFYDAPPVSGGLHSSRPPLPKQTDRKAIRTVDGFSKPKNVMSWEHRLESRISPNDLIYQPQILSRLRDQVRDARDKMDRHRQLLDRTPHVSTNSGSTGSSSSSTGTDPNNAPMSEVRRRVKRTLAKTRNSP